MRAAIQFVSALASGALIWVWMHHYFPDIIVQVRERYNVMVVEVYHYGFILSIMLVNMLVGVSFLNVYYRVYFV